MTRRPFRRQPDEPENEQPPREDNTPQERDLPPGVKLLYTLRGHESGIGRIAWSPDGQILASPSNDTTIRLWDAPTGQHLHTIKGHSKRIYNVTWSPDGQTLASTSADNTIRLWDPVTGLLRHTLKGHPNSVYSVRWTPDGQTLASASYDNTIRLWNSITGHHLRTLEGHSSAVYGIAWSPDGQTLASASDDTTIRLWDSTSGHHLRTLEGHSRIAWSVSWSPDGQTLASGSSDTTIRLWDPATGHPRHTLEGHTDTVFWVSFSPDGRLLVSQSSDSIRFWHGKTWDPVTTLAEATNNTFWLSGGSFNPRQANLLAAVGTATDRRFTIINIWQLDYDTLLSQAPTDTVGYTNSRVVLVGDTGVGKSGLALALMDQPWEPTDSTHARKIYTFEDTIEDLPDGRREQRETLLWDLAGQPGYRIIHQLQLTEVAVALLCFDARSDTDVFSGVKYWNRALNQALKAQGSAALPLRKFLVSARIDRGGLAASEERIQQLMDELDLDGYFETSAKETWGIAELQEAVRSGIEWDTLPRVSSTGLFMRIKDFLTNKKESGLLIATEEALYAAFQDSPYAELEDRDVRAEFATVIGRVESRGLIRRLTFGDLILLQPELLDVYASFMVFAARDEPDGMGCLAEEDARVGRFPMSLDERLPDAQREIEKLLLIATVEDLLRHEIALRDAGDLIFPSQFRREREDAPDPENKVAIYTFEGPVQNIYTRLVVRLARSGIFERDEMWRNAVTYRDRAVNGLCGLVLSEFDEGRAAFTLFFEPSVQPATKFYFESFVHSHLQQHALPQSISVQRMVFCPECGLDLTQSAKRRRERGLDSLTCSDCETLVMLPSEAEQTAPAPVWDMNQSANQQRDREAAVYTLQGKIATNDFDVFLCHNSEDKPAIRDISEMLKERGLYPWLDEEQLRPGFGWQRALENQIGDIKTAAVFVGENGFGPWQDMELDAFLREFVQRQCPVIPVVLPDCPRTPDLPIFLRGMQWVDFRVADPNPVDQLVWGITGQRRAF